jgi:phosphatidylethanolamine-binding protein (PEBP) family uncharacterized protein
MKIFINNSVIQIYNNNLYDYYLFDSNKPIIIFDFIKKNKYYTYLIINDENIHLLIINNNNIILNYEKPNPPKNSGIHIYYILIYQQNSIFYLKKNDSININLNNFIDKYNLLLIDKFIFKVIHK